MKLALTGLLATLVGFLALPGTSVCGGAGSAGYSAKNSACSSLLLSFQSAFVSDSSLTSQSKENETPKNSGSEGNSGKEKFSKCKTEKRPFAIFQIYLPDNADKFCQAAKKTSALHKTFKSEGLNNFSSVRFLM